MPDSEQDLTQGFGRMRLLRDEDGYIKSADGNVYGYVRISTTQQNVDRQLDQMEEYGIRPEHIFIEKCSGKNFNRPIYKQMLRLIRRGDIICISSLDRLGRNYQEILDQWEMLTKEIGVGIHVLNAPFLNTSGYSVDLTSKLITDIMLEVLSFAADHERVQMLARQKGGLAAKRKREVKDKDQKDEIPIRKVAGRKRSRIPVEFFDVYICWRTGEVPKRALKAFCINELGIKERTFYRRINELDSRFGNFPPERLKDIILDDYEENGFEYESEIVDQKAGIYNSWANNPYYKYKTGRKKKVMKLEDVDDMEDFQKIILEKRQQDFQKRFGLAEGEESPAVPVIDGRVIDTSSITSVPHKKIIQID